MYILDFGEIILTDANIKNQIEYTHAVNPDGDLMLGIAAMAELKFTVYDLNKIIGDTDITGKEFVFKKCKTSTFISKWDKFKAIKPDMMCMNGETAYSVKKNKFSINGKAVEEQPIEPIICIYIIGDRVYLGHSDKVSVYTLEGIKQPDISLTPFQKTQMVQGRSLNVQGDIIREYTIRLYDLKPTDFMEKTSIFTQVGIFTALKPERRNQTNISVVSYDRMNRFEKVADDFVKSLDYPIIAVDMLKLLCEQVEIILSPSAIASSITNGNYMISNNFSVSNTTARTVLQWIAELSGSFAYINVLGQLEVQFYTPSNKVYSNENFKGIRQSEFVTAKIDKRQVKTEENDIGVIVGTGENAYIIENNPLLYTMSDAALRPFVQVLFDKIKDFSYKPTEFSTVLDNDFECSVGDLITINDIQTPVMVKHIKGLIETYSSSGNLKRSTQESKLNQVVKMLNGRTNEIITTVDEFSVTLTEVKDETQFNTAELLIQADQISSKVSQTDYNGNTISSLINQTATEILIQAEKINLSGYATFSSLSESGTTVINGDNITAGTINGDIINGGTINGANMIWGGGQVEMGAVDETSSGTLYAYIKAKHQLMVDTNIIRMNAVSVFLGNDDAGATYFNSPQNNFYGTSRFSGTTYFDGSLNVSYGEFDNLQIGTKITTGNAAIGYLVLAGDGIYKASDGTLRWR